MRLYRVYYTVLTEQGTRYRMCKVVTGFILGTVEDTFHQYEDVHIVAMATVHQRGN
jgi:hypothetical protein